MQITNTLTRRLETFEPLEPGHVRIYVCGMTTYDYCHIGHARAMLTFDVVVRHLRHRGYKVTFVRNYTDIDDKIIARGNEAGEDPLALSERFCRILDEDLDAMGMIRPDIAPKVTTHIPQIVAIIERLIERGHAYASGGDVWYDVASFPDYGKLSGKKVEELIAGERVDVHEGKRSPADFALWKSAKPGEPAWDSPWGRGRPGWHIECSAMSCEHLGEQFDIHGGGIDLVFPHHENEIAQSEGATGVVPFARTWMHNGHLTFRFDGQDTKMSKSLGNVVRIRDILAQVPAEALRLTYLDSHYRSPLPYSPERLGECVTWMARIYAAKDAALAMGGEEPAEKVAKDLDAQELLELGRSFVARFDEAMDQDFNTAVAVANLFELARAVNRFSNNKQARKRGGPVVAPALAAFALCGEVLGVAGQDPAAFFADHGRKHLAHKELSEAWVTERLAARQTAREAKDWTAADAIRAELTAADIMVMDGPTGATWRVKVD